jgi:hypothetical protein
MSSSLMTMQEISIFSWRSLLGCTKDDCTCLDVRPIAQAPPSNYYVAREGLKSKGPGRATVMTLYRLSHALGVASAGASVWLQIPRL